MSRPRRHRSSSAAVRIEVDLMMECEDEELSPWQQEATKKAEKEYKAAMDQIKHAKANNMKITRQEAGTPLPKQTVRQAQKQATKTPLTKTTPSKPPPSKLFIS